MLYHKMGSVPPKRHTIHEKPEGGIYYEQLFGTEGFHGLSSLLYHTHRPTMISSYGETFDLKPKAAIENNIKSRMLEGFNIKAKDDYLKARTPVLFNDDVQIDIASPKKGTINYFYKNSDSDEILFIQKGSGIIKTLFGELKFNYADYLVIPRGTIYKVEFETSDNKLLVIESKSPIVTPKRYRNEFGQLLEHSPFCERDIKLPENLVSHDSFGDYLIKVKKEKKLHEIYYASHPFDVVGWDGYLFPYAFNIKDFEPITGRIHRPPPVHQTFEAAGFVICSFIPRLFDSHPKSIPAPDFHSNIDSDELLYYVDGDFMSRRGVKPGQLTLHPAGIPHGPHPGTVEASLGKKKTPETAVMVATFKPLHLTQQALDLESPEYFKSWVK